MKILVSDLDGTIYRNKTVSAIDLKMINDFASRNMFVIATGRNENTFSFFSAHYDLAYQYVILCNGALIQDKNQQTIIKHSFNKDDDLTNIFEILHLYSNQQISVSLSFEKGGLYLPKWQDDLFDQVKANLSYEMLGICLEVVNKDLKVVENIYQQLLKNTSFNIERNNQYIDILPKGVSKKNAIKELIARCHLKEDNLYVIGDSYNDLSMFEIANESYAVENACKELKEKATGVIGRHDQDAVAHWLEKNYKG